MKTMKVAFRQRGEKKEIVERQINQAFDILFVEVIKKMQKKRLNYSFNKNVSVGGGDYLWAN